MSQITVYPTSKNAMSIQHPTDGPLESRGSLWTEDGFTARCLVDGAITTDKSAGFKSADVVDPSKPPAHATQQQPVQTRGSSGSDKS